MIQEDDTIVNVNNVYIQFNMATERVNHLKEYVIKLLKRQLLFQRPLYQHPLYQHQPMSRQPQWLRQHLLSPQLQPQSHRIPMGITTTCIAQPILGITTTTIHGYGDVRVGMVIVHPLQCGDHIMGVLDSIMAVLITIVGDWFYNKG